MIIGVDPHSAKPYAVAGVEGGSFMFAAKTSLRALHGLFGEGAVVAVEDQYLCRNFNTSKRLSWAAGMVMGAALLKRARVAAVNVASWKAWVARLVAERWPGVEGEPRAVLWEKTSGMSYDEDMASALGIALFAESAMASPVPIKGFEWVKEGT